MKQKILLITILFLVFITSVYGVNEILGSQYQSPDQYYIGYSNDSKYDSTTLILNSTGWVNRIDFALKKTGTPTGRYIQALIYDSADVLLELSNNTIDVSTLTTSYANYSFYFSNTPELIKGTSYRIALNITPITTSSSTDAGWGCKNFYTGYKIYGSSNGTTWSVLQDPGQCSYIVYNGTASLPRAIATFNPALATPYRNNTLGQNITAVCSNNGNPTIYFDTSATPSTIVSTTTTTNYTSWIVNSTIVTTDGYYYYWANCSNGTSVGSNIYTYIYDQQSPSIIINPSNTFSMTNTTDNIYKQNVTLNVSFSDDLDLYGMNITITYPNGSVFYNVEELTLNGTGYTFNKTIPISVSQYTNFLVKIQASDSHTNQMIGNYNPEVLPGRIKFDTPEGNKITIQSEDAGVMSAYREDSTKYGIGILYQDKTPKPRSFIVSANNYISIRQTKYTAHLVIKGNGINGNWLDFEGSNSKYSIKRLTDTSVMITFDSMTDTQFHSIGGLNVNTKYYTFTKDSILSTLAYTGNVAAFGVNYTRELNYTLSVSCVAPYTTQIRRFIGEKVNYTHSLECVNGTVISIKGNYTHDVEGYYNLSLEYYTTYNPTENNINLSKAIFKSDLYNPSASAGILINPGFTVGTANITLYCTDSATANLTYNLSLNDVSVQNGLRGVNSTIMNITALLNGINNITGICKDYFGSESDTTSYTIYVSNLCLIDEKTGAAFDVQNLSTVKVYLDENKTSYDLKANNQSCVYVSSNSTSSVARYELVYSDSTIITRYINPRLSEDGRVCANKEGVKHYQQIIFSALQKDVVLKNLFADCDIVADTTRFAYSDSFIVQAFSIDAQYYLYTFDAGEQVYLASVDGSLQSLINLDIIEFQTHATTVSISPDDLSFSPSGTNTIAIYYKNLASNNLGLNMKIYNMNTNDLLFNTSSFTNYNEFTVYFNYAGTTNLTADTLFKVELTKTTDTGDETIKRYFNTAAKSGMMAAGLALILAIFLTIFGMTFTVARLQFSFFGIFMIIGAIIILGLATPAWYITFFQVVEAILLIFAFTVLIKQNITTLA